MKKVALAALVFGMSMEIIEAADTKELNEFAKAAGLKGRKAKAELQKELASIVSQNQENAIKIASSKKLSRSEKMRQIFDLGITSPKTIADLTGGQYNFTYGVIRRHTGLEVRTPKAEAPAAEPKAETSKPAAKKSAAKKPAAKKSKEA